MEKLKPRDLKTKTEWLSYSLLDFLNEFNVDLGLESKEVYFLNQINLYVDKGDLVIDPRSSLIYMTEGFEDEEFIMDILTNLIPDKVKEAIYKNFDMSSIKNVCLYLGFDYFVLDDKQEKQSYIDIEDLKDANIMSRR